jgi:hypothetical protein
MKAVSVSKCFSRILFFLVSHNPCECNDGSRGRFKKKKMKLFLSFLCMWEFVFG